MGSPKRRARIRGPLWRRCVYRVVYMCLVLASGYLILAQFRSRLAPSASEHLAGHHQVFSRDGSDTDASGQSSHPPPHRSAANENRSPQTRKWIEKPDSLCYGIGNITILSITPSLPQAFLEQLRKNRLAYAYQHGYRYCEVSTVLDLFSPVPWSRINALMLVLSFADVVVHMHSDALIRNHSISIESIINMPDYNLTGKDIIYSTHFGAGRNAEPDMKGPIETGVFIVKSSIWSKAYLEVLCQFFRTSLSFHKLSEDEAIERYRSNHFEEFRDHATIIPFRYFNSPCGEQQNYYQPGDFVARYLGSERLEKYERLATMLRMEDELT